MRRGIHYEGPVYRANRNGCPACGGKGYKGRVGIHEVMATSDQLVEGINKELETVELKKIAMFNGMYTLHQDSLKKVKAGITSIEEAIATVPPDLEDMESLADEFALKTETKAKQSRERKEELASLKEQNTPKS